MAKDRQRLLFGGRPPLPGRPPTGAVAWVGVLHRGGARRQDQFDDFIQVWMCGRRSLQRCAMQILESF